MMLADSRSQTQYGGFLEEIHLPHTARYELFDFVVSQLPKWRDHPSRPASDSESELTSALCAHLNTAARFSKAWNRVQFLNEDPDEARRGRKTDLTARPCGTICIDGRRFTEFDKLFPIECKRLPMPTPSDKKRDVREYVINANASTGGIQRFKDGNHGSAHNFAGMIGYVQDNTALGTWLERINGWIEDLVNEGCVGWTKDDSLSLESEDTSQRTCQCRSVHTRDGFQSVELRHGWIILN